MSKRSSAPGGYPHSDAEPSDHEEPTPKKQKPYQPAMLSRAGTSGRTFQHSPANPPVWSSGRTQTKPAAVSNPPPAATPKPPPFAAKSSVQQSAQAAIPTPAKTPDTRKGQRTEWDELDSDASNPPESPVASKRAESRPEIAVQGNLVPKNGVQDPTRRRFYLEGKVNELEEGLEAAWAAVKVQEEALKSLDSAAQKRHEELRGMLDDLFGLFKSSPAVLAPAQPSEPSKAPKVEETTNLLGDPSHEELRELQDLVGRVCSSTAIKARAGTNEKPKPRDNQMADVIRKVFLNEIGIKKLSEIRPPMKKTDGTPDLFPEFLMDPLTGRSTPCPDWDSGLPEQVEWIYGFLWRFRVEGPTLASTKDCKERVKTMTDEDIIARLHDGVYRSAKAEWSRHKSKGEEYVETARIKAKRNARMERKAANRATHRDSIPGLQGPEWNFLFHKDVMSPEVSDEEGRRRVEDPGWRAQWMRNVLGAMDVASVEQARNQRGFRPPPRRVHVTVSTPIPVLKDSSKNTVRIPICALSHKWRKENPEAIKVPHIHPTFNTPPDIDDFLNAHPLDNSDYYADDEEVGDEVTKVEGGAAKDAIEGFGGSGEGAGGYEGKVRGGDMGKVVGPGQEVDWESGGEPQVSLPSAQEVSSGDEAGEQPAMPRVPRVLVPDSQPTANLPTCAWATSRALRNDPLSAPSFGSAPDIPIDPALQDTGNARGMAVQLTATIRPRPKMKQVTIDPSAGPTAPDPSTQASTSASAHHANSDVDHEPHDGTQHAAAPPTSAEWSRSAHPPMPPPPPLPESQAVESQAASQVEASTSGQAAQPGKRRPGRPKGSKNKPKADKD
ncbi:hypothetical protein FRC12_007480 [Ceratobasidium sp. 428]|nr:hypothetical protein FRC12_007480 [Ceratobasidium sp. 428]